MRSTRTTTKSTRSTRRAVGGDHGSDLSDDKTPSPDDGNVSMSSRSKYRGVKLSPSASLFSFDFQKKRPTKKSSDLNASGTAQESDAGTDGGGRDQVGPRNVGAVGSKGETPRRNVQPLELRKDIVSSTSGEGRAHRKESDSNSEFLSEDENRRGGSKKSSDKEVGQRDKARVDGSAQKHSKVRQNNLESKENVNSEVRVNGASGKQGVRNVESQKNPSNVAPVESRNNPSVQSGKTVEELMDADADEPSSHVSVTESSTKSFGREPGTKLYGNVKIPCLVDRNIAEYSTLQNAAKCTHVNVGLSSPVSTYMEPQSLQWGLLCPGVHMAVTVHVGPLKTGYIRIEAKTVKPLERTVDGFIGLAVIDGSIVAKSSSFAFNGKGEPYLASAELREGSYILIPQGTMYSLENWTDEEASLHFILVATDEP